MTDGTTGDLTDNANPYYDLYSPNVRCGRGAATSGRGIKTLVVNAGDQIEFWATQRDRLGKVKEVRPIFSTSGMETNMEQRIAKQGMNSQILDKITYLSRRTRTGLSVQSTGCAGGL